MKLNEDIITPNLTKGEVNMADGMKPLYSLLTLDLNNATDYRDGFYKFLDSYGWSKRQEADTAWTRVLSVPKSANCIEIADLLTTKLTKIFNSYLRTQWEIENGPFPLIMNVKGIMQIGDEGYFSIDFYMKCRPWVAKVSVECA